MISSILNLWAISKNSRENFSILFHNKECRKTEKRISICKSIFIFGCRCKQYSEILSHRCKKLFKLLWNWCKLCGNIHIISLEIYLWNELLCKNWSPYRFILFRLRQKISQMERWKYNLIISYISFLNLGTLGRLSISP